MTKRPGCLCEYTLYSVVLLVVITILHYVYNMLLNRFIRKRHSPWSVYMDFQPQLPLFESLITSSSHLQLKKNG